MKFFLLLLIFYGSIVYSKCGKPLPEVQPGCDYCSWTMIFYENHAYYVKDIPSGNWICHEPYPKLLKYCYTMYKLFTTSKYVESNYTVIRDEDSVEKECKRHTMTFLQPDSSVEADKRLSNVTLDVRMFHCPITKMKLLFPRGDKPRKIVDFYIAEGRNEGTLAVLHNSTTSDNVCVTHMYRPARDFIREYFK